MPPHASAARRKDNENEQGQKSYHLSQQRHFRGFAGNDNQPHHQSKIIRVGESAQQPARNRAPIYYDPRHAMDGDSMIDQMIENGVAVVADYRHTKGFSANRALSVGW